jgi:hypothetical protein
MALSPQYSWPEPDNSSLVKNGAQDIRALGDAIDTSVWNVGYGQAGKNKIINGNFGVWARGTSFSNPANGAYTADRFLVSYDGTGATRTISQQTFTPGTAPVAGYEGTFFYRYDKSVGGTSSTFDLFSQRMEDVRLFAGQTITVSYWAKASKSLSLDNFLAQRFGSGGSSTVVTAITAQAITTSWARYTATVSVPSISGKTIGTGSNLDFTIRYLNVNDTFTLDVWGVQVEAGSIATPFQTATGTIQGELAACQRYYYRLTPAAVGQVMVQGQNINTTTCRGLFYFPVEMRIAPTALETSGTANQYEVLSLGGAATTCSAVPIFASGSTRNAMVSASVASGLTDIRPAAIRTDTTNGATSYLGWSAEL